MEKETLRINDRTTYIKLVDRHILLLDGLVNIPV